MSIGEQTAYTASDLLEMPDGDRYELAGGQLVEREMGAESSWVAGNVHTHLNNFVLQHELGWALPEGTSFQCFPDDPERVRRPDVSFIARGRLASDILPRGHCRIAPDLAVEVVSPRDSYYEVDQKVSEYLAAGVQQVWVVNPDNRTLRVHHLNGPLSHLNENDVVSGEDLLPVFGRRVGDFFPPARQENSSADRG
ncbi:MAG: Uma2 family endonuclease [Planctomycetes bacterium]|nr:Uma2 family endonuclease [Planctomycetota bacterium]